MVQFVVRSLFLGNQAIAVVMLFGHARDKVLSEA